MVQFKFFKQTELDQFGGDVALVANGNGVGVHEAVIAGVRLSRNVVGFDANGDGSSHR